MDGERELMESAIFRNHYSYYSIRLYYIIIVYIIIVLCMGGSSPVCVLNFAFSRTGVGMYKCSVDNVIIGKGVGVVAAVCYWVIS